MLVWRAYRCKKVVVLWRWTDCRKIGVVFESPCLLAVTRIDRFVGRSAPYSVSACDNSINEETSSKSSATQDIKRSGERRQSHMTLHVLQAYLESLGDLSPVHENKHSEPQRSIRKNCLRKVSSFHASQPGPYFSSHILQAQLCTSCMRPSRKGKNPTTHHQSTR